MAKKYYWLKLKRDFFTSKEMKKLRKIAGGDTYTIIYLKLQLLSLQDGGKLYFDGVEETFADELALVLDEDSDNVKATVIFLEKCGLIEMRSEHEIMMTAVPEVTGEESEAAERMRRLRKEKTNKIEQKANIGEQSANNIQKRSTEKEKESELEREEETETEGAQSAPPPPSKPTRHRFGEYQNVLLTDTDLEKLQNEFPDDWQSRIESLSGYIKSTGKVYKDHLATIRNWARRDAKEPKRTTAPRTGSKENLNDFYKRAAEWAESEGT